MDSYDNTNLRIGNLGNASRPRDILKGVKQDCPLSLLLFNICVDPLISFIRKSEGLGYRTKRIRRNNYKIIF
jgi:hypothetical protein